MAFTRTAAGVVALGTALSLGFPAAAAADDPLTRLVLDDPSGDVWQSPAGDGTVQVDDMPTADVVSASVVHGRRNLTVTATFADLQQVDRQTYAVELMTPGHEWYSLNIDAGPENWDGTLRGWAGGDGREGDEHRLRCPDATHRIDYEADTVDLVVPRSCVGRPEWVRAAIVNWLDQGSPEGEGQSFWDNPHNAGSEGGTTRRLWRAPAPDSTEAPAPYRADLTDPTGDVWTSAGEFVPAPYVPTADVRRTTISHGAHRLTLRIEFTDLEGGGRQSYDSWILSRQDEHYLFLRVTPRHPEGVTRLYSGSVGRIGCERLAHDVDLEANRVVISVPRGCLGRPDWVRMHVGTYFQPAPDSTPETEFYIDDPHSDQAFSEGLTPRIHTAAGS